MDNGASSYRRFLDGEESAFEKIMQELFHNLVSKSLIQMEMESSIL